MIEKSLSLAREIGDRQGVAITPTVKATLLARSASTRRPKPRRGALGTRRGPAQSIPVAVDLVSPDGPDRLVAEAVATCGVDILVNNIGAVRPRLSGFLAITDVEWQCSLEINSSPLSGQRARRCRTYSNGPVDGCHHRLGSTLSSRTRA